MSKPSGDAPVAGRVVALEALLESAELAKKRKRQELRAWRQVACMDNCKLQPQHCNMLQNIAQLSLCIGCSFALQRVSRAYEAEIHADHEKYCRSNSKLTGSADVSFAVRLQQI